MKANLKSSSLESRLIPIHEKIIAAQANGKKILSIEEFRVITAWITTLHGIPLSDQMTVKLCLEFWEDKYMHLMTKDEIKLAFESNVKLELGDKKIIPYQVFSVDFFTSVLNAYLQIKKETLRQRQEIHGAAESNKQLPPPDPTISILEQIIVDFKTYHATERKLFVDDYDFWTGDGFPTAIKLEYIHKVFELKIIEEHFIELRDIAAKWVIRNLSKKRNELRGVAGKGIQGQNEDNAPQTSAFGAIISGTNQIARLQAGRLITEADERLIQHEVKRLLYLEALFMHKPFSDKNETLNDCRFVRDIRNYIADYRKSK